MKKLYSVLLALAMLCTVAACGAGGEKQQASVPPVSDTEQTSDDTGLPEENAEVPGDSAQQVTQSLEINVEGEAVSYPASPFAGAGYTVLIPAEGWSYESDSDDGITEDSWEYTSLDDVEFKVLNLRQKTLEEAIAWVEWEEDDCTFVKNEDGTYTGTDEADMEFVDVRYVPAGEQMYVALGEYPMDAAEGMGILMQAMARSVTLTA